jgi:hypothetical protein
MSITLEDINGNKSIIEPDIRDVLDTSSYGYAGPPTNHYRRKALNGFTLSGNVTKVIKIDLSSIPGSVGGLDAVSYSGCATGPFYCPTTHYTLDPSKIKDVLLTVNFGSSDINLSEGDGDPTLDTYVPGTSISAYTGVIKLYDFKIGTLTTTGINDPTQTDGSLSVYPNPAKETLNVSFDATGAAEVSLSDMVGNKVYSTSTNAGTNQVTMNTASLPSGIYILNVTTDKGKVARKVTIQ